MSRLRLVLAEWLLVAAALPAVAILLAAAAGWWAEATAVDAALLFNTIALFGAGAWAARTAGHGWPSSCRAGALDMLIGLVIIIANALIKLCRGGDCRQAARAVDAGAQSCRSRLIRCRGRDQPAR